MGRGPTNENTNMYFQARKKAATYNERLWSREGAAELLGISVSTLADYELGNTKVVPVDKVVLMADLYNAPELITGYCMRECPVHGFLPLATEEKSLEGIALRLLQNFNEDSLKNMRDSLIEITADGKITKDELPALEKIIGQLEKMAEVISEMKIAGEKYLNGKQAGATPERSSELKKASKRRILFAARMATMVGAACFAVSGISETLGQEKEKSRPVYIATEEVAETTYMPEVEETTQPTETAKAVETEEPLIASMDWDKDDSYLLCKIAMAEAESEGVKGKALVMLVVLNRVWSNEFPDTIEEVIFRKNQFSPVANGRYDAVEPDEECYEALKLIQVDHWNESQDALYFESKSDSKWHSENLEFLFKYGKHYFYK